MHVESERKAAPFQSLFARTRIPVAKLSQVIVSFKELSSHLPICLALKSSSLVPSPHKKKRKGSVNGKSKGPFTQAIFVAQLNASFVAPKLQLQYRACKPAAILSPRYRRSFEPVRNLMQYCRDF